MVIKCPFCPGFKRYRYASLIRFRQMPTSSIRKEGRECTSEVFGIVIVIHENSTTITDPCYDWYFHWLLHIYIRCVFLWLTYHFHQCHDHLELRVLTLSFNIAVNCPTCYGAISHVVQCMMKIIFRKPFHVAGIRPTLVRIPVLW